MDAGLAGTSGKKRLQNKERVTRSKRHRSANEPYAQAAFQTTEGQEGAATLRVLPPEGHVSGFLRRSFVMETPTRYKILCAPEVDGDEGWASLAHLLGLRRSTSASQVVSWAAQAAARRHRDGCREHLSRRRANQARGDGPMAQVAACPSLPPARRAPALLCTSRSTSHCAHQSTRRSGGKDLRSGRGG